MFKTCSNDKVNGRFFLCPSFFYVQSNLLNPWILQLKYKTDHYLLKIYLPIIIANLINFHNKTNVGQWNESRTWSHISFVIKNFFPIFLSVIVITIKLKLIILRFHYLCKRLKIKIIKLETISLWIFFFKFRNYFFPIKLKMKVTSDVNKTFIPPRC